MDKDSSGLFKELRRAGLSVPAIRAAWPAWWSDELAASPSSRAELRFALARKLGLAPKPLLGERVEFIWKDNARFKHLGTESASDLSVLSSFGVSVGRMVLRGAPLGPGFEGISAKNLRASILASAQYVDLQQLIAACWALGVPVVHLRIFPLANKSMHAMVVESAGRGAVLLGRDSSYPSSLAFTLAHEIGHMALGHIRSGTALVDIEDPSRATDRDHEETEADAFALTLLTGTPDPQITTDLATYDAPTLARTVMNAGPTYRIEPGSLALCVGYRQRNWPVVMSSLSFIYPHAAPIWQGVNGIARSMIEWTALSADEGEFVHNLLSLDDV